MLSISLKLLLPCLFSLSLGAAESKPEGEVGAPLSKEEKEFIDKTSKLNSTTSRIVEAEKKFAELIHQKALAKTPDEKQRIVKEMIELTKQRNTDAETFNKLKADLTLRYPNRGQAINRRYQTQVKRSIEEMEGAAGLDEILTHTKKAIDRKYAPLLQDEKEAPSAPMVVQPTEEKPKRLRLEK